MESTDFEFFDGIDERHSALCKTTSKGGLEKKKEKKGVRDD
jgi:hypothetical protein